MAKKPIKARGSLITRMRELTPGTGQMVAQSNPDRIFLLFASGDGTPFFVSPLRQLAFGTGIRVDNTTGPQRFRWTDDFSLVQEEWFASQAGAGGPLLVVEVLYQ